MASLEDTDFDPEQVRDYFQVYPPIVPLAGGRCSLGGRW